MGSIFKRADSGGKKGHWYVEYTDHVGRRVRACTRTTDKQTAKTILAKLESDAALRRSGAIDARTERFSKQAVRPISEHLEEFESKMHAAKRDPKHIRQTMLEIRAGLSACECLREITPEAVDSYLATLREQNRSARKMASVVQSVRSFTKWCVESGRLPADPLAIIKKPSSTKDRRLERRPLTRDEWAKLQASIDGEHYGMTAAARKVLYRLALETGLRSAECRALTIAGLFLDSQPPFVLLGGDNTKNEEPARQYITRELAEDLRALSSGRNGPLGRMGAIFPELPPTWRVIDMFRIDLEAAGITSTPRAQVDFHSLRHTCGTWLAQANVHPKAIQQIMRHSDIRLTIQTYGHLFPSQEADAIASTFASSNGQK